MRIRRKSSHHIRFFYLSHVLWKPMKAFALLFLQIITSISVTTTTALQHIVMSRWVVVSGSNRVVRLGICRLGSLDHSPSRGRKNNLWVNLWGAERLTRAFLPLLVESSDGWVINVGSGGGRANLRKMCADNRTKLLDDSVTWSDIENMAHTFIRKYEDAATMATQNVDDENHQKQARQLTFYITVRILVTIMRLLQGLFRSVHATIGGSIQSKQEFLIRGVFSWVYCHGHVQNIPTLRYT